MNEKGSYSITVASHSVFYVCFALNTSWSYTVSCNYQLLYLLGHGSSTHNKTFAKSQQKQLLPQRPKETVIKTRPKHTQV